MSQACACGECFFLAEPASKYCKHHRASMEAYDAKHAPTAPSLAPSKAEHGLAHAVIDRITGYTGWMTCKCTYCAPIEQFNAHVAEKNAAAVRRETMEKVAEKWDIILHDEESDNAEHILDFSGWIEGQLKG